MPKLKISNSSNGRSFDTLTGVLAHVALTSVSTTSGNNTLTVGSTTGIYPGMSIQAPNVPPGSIVNAVISSTQLELFRSVFNATTGVASHSAANAQATATASGGIGHALSFNPQALVYQTYIEGTWRNTHRLTNNWLQYTIGGTGYPEKSGGAGVAVAPTAITVSNGMSTMTTAIAATTDELKETPVKRHDGEPHACLLVVHTGGMLSVIHQPHLKNLTYAGE
jgi:hypothetical protein